tara:strand:+ start:68614 stop:69387 length:774 start_codon:yes stop_codon:yes gene_type:complete
MSNAVGQVTLLEENFDTQGLPTGWERVDNDGNTPASDVSEYTEAWIYKEDPINAGNGTFSSTSYFDPIDRADRWLITPSVTLGASGNFISWKGLSSDPSFPDSYKVLVSTTDTDLASFTDTLLLVTNESPDWTEHELSLEEYASQTIHFAFVNTSFDGFKLYLDSVYVREQDPLQINEEELSVNVYPNPVQESLQIETKENVSNVSIISSVGTIVYDETYTKNKDLTINVSELPNGLYTIVIELASGKPIRKKIVKS